MSGAGPRLAVFGGSFDPPHVGHLLAIAYVAACEPVDAVVVVPAFDHAFGKQYVAPFASRLAWVRAMVAGMPSVEVDPVAATLPKPGYTLDLLRALGAARPGATLRLVVGSDILGETHRWHRWDDVCALAPPIVLGRGGHPEVPGKPTLPDVSSTEVRARLRAGVGVDGLVPRAVLEALAEAGFPYGAACGS